MDTTQRDLALETLSEATMAGDPMTQFAGWMAQARERGIPEPTAMVLATTSADGRPRARTVLLKAHGLVDVDSDPVLDLVEAQAQRMIEEGREPVRRGRYMAWGEVGR